MKICLECGAEFNKKRPDAIFCSNICKVRNHRKNKKNSTKRLNDSQKLDKILDALEKINLQPIIIEQEKEVKKSSSNFGSNNYSNITVTNKIKTAAEYSQAKLDCENEDQWRELVEEINNAPNLTDREKKILTTF